MKEVITRVPAKVVDLSFILCLADHFPAGHEAYEVPNMCEHTYMQAKHPHT